MTHPTKLRRLPVPTEPRKLGFAGTPGPFRGDPGVRRRRRVPATLIAGAVLVGLVVAAALVSFVWTPHDAERVDVPIQFLPPGTPGYPLGTISWDAMSSRSSWSAPGYASGGNRDGGAGDGPGRPAGCTGGALPPARGGDHAGQRRPPRVSSPAPGDALRGRLPVQHADLDDRDRHRVRPGLRTVVRGAGLQVVSQGYVTASRAFGAGGWWLFGRHLLPNVLSLVIVQATVASRSRSLPRRPSAIWALALRRRRRPGEGC